MTTIAYRDGIIAYDSRMTDGLLICDDDCDKHSLEKGVHFFFAGDYTDTSTLREYYFDRTVEKKIARCEAIVVDKGIVSNIGYHREYYYNQQRQDNVLAIGSGTEHALTAMDMGATAKEAVKWAIKRNTGTGGKIRTFKV